MLNISEHELSEFQFSMDQILTAKYVFEKTGNHIYPFHYFETLEFDIDFFTNAVEVAFDVKTSYGNSLDEDTLDLIFEWPIWKRITESKWSEKQRAELSSLVGKYNSYGMTLAEILYEDHGMIRIKCEDVPYVFTSPIIKELMDVEKAWIEFEKKNRGV